MRGMLEKGKTKTSSWEEEWGDSERWGCRCSPSPAGFCSERVARARDGTPETSYVRVAVALRACSGLTTVHRETPKSCITRRAVREPALSARQWSQRSKAWMDPVAQSAEGKDVALATSSEDGPARVSIARSPPCLASVPFVLIASSLRLLSSGQRSGWNRDCEYSFAFRSYSAVSWQMSTDLEFRATLQCLRVLHELRSSSCCYFRAASIRWLGAHQP